MIATGEIFSLEKKKNHWLVVEQCNITVTNRWLWASPLRRAQAPLAPREPVQPLRPSFCPVPTTSPHHFQLYFSLCFLTQEPAVQPQVPINKGHTMCIFKGWCLTLATGTQYK